MKTFFAILILLFPISSFCQNTILKKFDGYNTDYCTNTTPANDGGYLMSGYTKNFGAGNEDIYLLKVDSLGNLQWAKTYGDTGKDYSYKIRETHDGGYIIVGSTNSFKAGNTDVYLLKTDDTGKLLWSKTFGGSGLEKGYDVQETSNGDFIIAGISENYVSNNMLYFIRTDSVGNLKFTKTYDQIFGFDWIKGPCLEELNDHSIIIGGNSAVGPSQEHVVIMKIDSTGIVQWTKAYLVGYRDNFISVQKTNDNGFIILNFSYDDTYDLPSLVKTDSNGNRLWTKLYKNWMISMPYYMQQTKDSGYIVSGYTDPFSKPVYFKVDALGNAQWSRFLSGYGSITYIKEGMDGKFTFSGIGNITNYSSSGFIYGRTDSLGSTCTDSLISSGTYHSFDTTDIDLFPVLSSLDSTETVNTITGYASPTEIDVCLASDIKNVIHKEYISVYPNPSNGIINFEAFEMIIHVKILNSLGQTVYDKDENKTKATIDIGNRSKGLYYYLLSTDKKTITGKIILQ